MIYNRSYHFEILSTDVILCPFQLGFITMRLKLNGSYETYEVMEFLHHLRILEPKFSGEKM